MRLNLEIAHCSTVQATFFPEWSYAQALVALFSTTEM